MRTDGCPGMAGRRHLIAFGVTCVLGLLVVGEAWSGPPTDQLRSDVERVLRILDDPRLKKQDALRERRNALRQLANEVFDLPEMAKRALARHWPARTPAERDEFVQLFGDLLERAYITRMDSYTGEKITGEKVAFVGESIDGHHATVRTRVVTRQGREIPLDFRLLRQGDRWRAYDVAIEGVSLVANYRAQFNAVIQKSSYDGLLRVLKDRHDERVAGGADPKTQRAAGTAER